MRLLDIPHIVGALHLDIDVVVAVGIAGQPRSGGVELCVCAVRVNGIDCPCSVAALVETGEYIARPEGYARRHILCASLEIYLSCSGGKVVLCAVNAHIERFGKERNAQCKGKKKEVKSLHNKIECVFVVRNIKVNRQQRYCFFFKQTIYLASL